RQTNAASGPVPGPGLWTHARAGPAPPQTPRRPGAVMMVRVNLFARARDLVGERAVEVVLPDGATVRNLRERLAALYPRLAELLRRSACAVDDEFADEERTVPAEAEVALLPPVSGGCQP